MSLSLVVPNAHVGERFRLDGGRLASHLIASGGERFGIDSDDERGFAAAVATRFADAKQAEAIRGPAELEVMVYAINPHGLIVALRERELPSERRLPLRQLATYSFDADEVACYGDERFEECCAAINELLDRANALLPSFLAMRAGERRTDRSDPQRIERR
jgi:hypothetical protein